MTSLTLQAPAKINLTLDILKRREDGFHELCMVMQSVSLRLESGNIRLSPVLTASPSAGTYCVSQGDTVMVEEG